MAGGTIAQTAALQAALDEAALSGTPLFLPPGTYKTDRLTLKSGAQLQGVPGRTVLVAHAHADGILEISGADAVRLSGLALDGGGIAFGEASALLTATETTNLDISGCRFLNSGAHGVSLQGSSGRIATCEFEAIAKTAVSSEDGNDVEISHNIVDTAAMGISISGVNESGRLAVVQGNHIRNLFHRKIGACGGVGIGVDADCSVTGNVIENAPAYGILVGGDDRPHSVTVTGNAIRTSHIGIGVSVTRNAGTAHIAENLIDGTKDGAIR
ncbi:MAG: right-handed parallel beta-helix repeat-containing protein, partial [Methyloligellaceae bacterium]